MAAYTEVRSTHPTLSTTTADTVTLTGSLKKVQIVNHNVSVLMYATVSQTGATPTTAVSAADDTFVIPPRGVLTLRTFGIGFVCSVVGNANAYSVVGYDNTEDELTFAGPLA